MINYNHLYYFNLVASLGGVTPAARLLRIAQPSLSAQLKTLERNLGLKLLMRSGRGLRLTPDGERVFEHCRLMFSAAEGLERMLQKGEQGPASLSLGVSNEIERPFLVEIVGSLTRRYGSRSPRIQMVSGSHEILISRLRSRGVDAVIVNHPVFDSSLEALCEAPVPVGLTFKAGGSYQGLAGARRESLRTRLQDIAPPLVLPLRGMRLRTEIQDYLERIRCDATRLSFESDVLAAVVRAILDDIGVGFLPYSYVSRHVEQGRLGWLAPEQGLWQHRLWFVARRGESATNGLLRILSANFKRLLRV